MKKIIQSRFVKSSLIALFLTILVVALPIPRADAALTSSQIQAIVYLLQVFGIDANTVANVQSILSGDTTTPTVPTTSPTSTSAIQIIVTHPQAGNILDNSGGKDGELIANIQWSSKGTGSETLNISLLNSNEGLVKVIAVNIPNTGTYAWKYDSSILNGNYKLSIFNDKKNWYGVSGIFSITGNNPTSTSTTHAHGTSPWNYGWDDFTSGGSGDHSAQILADYNAHPDQYGYNPFTISSGQSYSGGKYLLRLYKACNDNWINRKEKIPLPGTYYNYTGSNRYQEHCINDGTFDNYYDEAILNETVSTPIQSGTVKIIARVGGIDAQNSGNCVSNLSTPSGNNTGECTRTLTNQTPGVYSLQWYSGYPIGADTTKSPTITSSQTLTSGGSIVFYLNFSSSSTQTTSPGILTASLDSTNPPAANVQPGQTGVEMLKINFSASGNNVTVNQLQISSNAGAVGNFVNLKLYDGTTLIAGPKNLDPNVFGPSTPTAIFPMSLIVPVNTPKIITVKADIASSASGSGNFYVSGISLPNNGGDVRGFNIVGKTMTITTSTQASSISISLMSGVGYSPATDQTVVAGTPGGTYFAFKITPQGEPMKITSLKLTAQSISGLKPLSAGIMSLMFNRIYLYEEGVSTPFAQTAGGYANCISNECSFSFSASDNLLSAPVPLTGKIIYLKADIGENQELSEFNPVGSGFRFAIKSTADVKVKGAVTGNTSVPVYGTPIVNGATSIVSTTISTPLPSPTWVSINLSGSNVVLNWNPTPGASAYGIYRDDLSSRVASTTSTTWTDISPTCGVGHTYYIDAYDENRVSTKSIGMQAGVSCINSGDSLPSSIPASASFLDSVGRVFRNLIDKIF